MKKQFAQFALAALAVAAAPAFAADTGVYLGADLNRTKFSAEGDSESKTGFGVFAGYALNPNVAFEAKYARLGNWREDGVRIDVNTLNLSVLGKAPLSTDLTLFGRLGMARNGLEVGFGNVTVSEHKNKALIGVGLDYALSPQVALRAEFVNLGNNKIGSGVDSVSIKMRQVNLGLTYAF